MVPNLLGDRYEVGRLLGSGPAADVFEGWDRLLGRRIAIKVLRELLADDERILTGFRRAASSAAGLSHPGIVGTNDAEIDRGSHFVVMELVDGRTLADLLADEAPLAPARAAEIGAAVAAALGHAHTRGVLHTDLRPSNLMITPDGSVKVLNFGGASTRVGDRDDPAVAAYRAPEETRGIRVDARADLYALGCVLYEMLTGRTPSAGRPRPRSTPPTSATTRSRRPGASRPSRTSWSGSCCGRWPSDPATATRWRSSWAATWTGCGPGGPPTRPGPGRSGPVRSARPCPRPPG